MHNPLHAGSLDGFLRAFVEKFKHTTVNSKEWKEFFLEYFHKQVNDAYSEMTITSKVSRYVMSVQLGQYVIEMSTIQQQKLVHMIWLVLG